ncbi:MAG: septum formation inhibitor Maf [Chromatiales bacterium]|nr:MAG: septum formation inhibitor Maf [Chromatiales bacterium]
MQPPVYLASASPRRRELLQQLGVACVVCPADVDESSRRGERPEEYVRRVAVDKAQAVAASVAEPAALVLAADTAVVQDGKIFGKPTDRADALQMLAALSGATHEVFSGVAVVSGTDCRHAVSRSAVRFRAISPGEAGAYWHTGEPADKAGAYAIQGLGAMFVEALQGSYSGVMGLPLFDTARLLESFGYRLLGNET